MSDGTVHKCNECRFGPCLVTGFVGHRPNPLCLTEQKWVELTDTEIAEISKYKGIKSCD